MKKLKYQFFTYRYLVVKSSNQVSLFPTPVAKEKLMINLIHQLVINKKSEWKNNNKKYIFYGVAKKNEISIIKFAKLTNEQVPIEGERDIELQKIMAANFIYLIVDTKTQIVLIQQNQNAFSNTEVSVNLLTKYFQSKMQKHDYAVNIYPLASSEKFWTYVDTSESIFELSLKMNAPNMPFFWKPRNKGDFSTD